MTNETADRFFVLQRVLGKGIHPAAIERLLELVPDARVQVRHSRRIEELRGESFPHWVVVRFGNRRTLAEMRERNPNRRLRFASHGGKTEVLIAREGDERAIFVGFAHCSVEDAFSRSVGREVAFRRMLKLLPAVARAE